jgi:hypothetical protein
MIFRASEISRSVGGAMLRFFGAGVGTGAALRVETDVAAPDCPAEGDR